jgi:hypothetical protein
MTYFEVVSDQKPSSILSYMPSVSKVQKVDKNLTIQEVILPALKENLVMVHSSCIKQQADQGHFKRQFTEGD